MSLAADARNPNEVSKNTLYKQENIARIQTWKSVPMSRSPEGEKKMAGTERREIPVAAAVQRFAATAQQNVAIFATSHRGREVRDGAVGGARGTGIQHSPP
jgi:hypothetical protein